MAARAVGELARRAGRGGGTSLPGKVLIAARAARDRASWPRGCRAGRAVISATNGKTTTAAMTASILERAGHPAGPQPRRREHGRRRRLDAARRGASGADGSTASSGCSRSTSSGSTGSRPSCDPRAVLLGNLFRDQLDRYGELETIADRWADGRRSTADARPLVLNADDPLIADLGRERRGRHLFRRRGSVDGAAARCSTPRTPSTAAAAAPRTATTRSTSATSATTTARTAASGAPIPTVAAEQIELDGHARRAASGCARPAGDATVSLPLPGLYNVYNALGAAALCLALGVDARAGRRRARGGRPPRSGAPRRSRSATIELSILLIKNPAGANEILRTLALESRRARRARGAQRPDRRRPRRLLGLGRRLRAARRRGSAASPAPGTRAAELALRLKYAGVAAERLHGRRRSWPRRSTQALAGAAERPAVRAADLHRAARAARRARRAGATSPSSGSASAA